MRAVGIKDLKNNLSSFLDFVRGGETVLILDRNQPIAEIKKVDPKSDRTQLYLKEAANANSIIPAKTPKGINIPKSILLNAGVKTRVSTAWREAYQADRD
ncbi:prevent-host-death family protein [Leptospira selangorensis]|uniref:Antitoxin n=1 Tax=Leptospira selangorensis TaxID=2484982 RepID=A0A5F2C9Z2_9LEPT|nr:type II toxin-antitoxin system Phd/YefM family antitoxin [Leptospira selangorensis]TGM12759.1 prevent-host-death family protein [Leptospira selangorensis]TGM30820.1 prevent-host-death family protein [Leptospira selangorensis]